MNTILEYQGILENEIQKISFPKEPANLYDPLTYFLTLGGKRTRPTLAMLGANLFGEPGIKALNAAIAVELFHNFTLIHDDIMDDAPLRRGMQTVHEKWDTNVGILSGDALFVVAYQYLAKHDVDVLPRLLEIFSKTALEVCEGQQMDMDFETRDDVSIDEYIEMIRLKTSVLLGAALEMGATIAKASKEDAQHIYDFGMNIGLAFQIQDDILDLYADPEKFGKQVGGDVIANKKTYLQLSAYQHASETTHGTLKTLETETDLAEKVSQVRSIFDEIGVREMAEQKKEEFYQNALTAMEKINVPAANKENLLGLAKMLMSREV
ncbi:geranylgeranyl diphosphate synthase, type II [Lishizhenia tianjinensis]|uniref:Geranylgeranyl diphosphate synthase, type II n=1 Tax=Lishizhenia tianjinensis TaxID=477690 RepID=A0A1I6ZVS3_9FLAO|nr:polyprenyl synthetase family protein [Lishizhenia tianjinensis]SFT66715.1 geranylgeranyl diphosphate synthase, type II [Lishizhenia tianjinensis]